MCGRFALAADEAELESEFEGVVFPKTFAARFNIAPSQPVLAIPNDGKKAADFFLWGLVPSWAKDASIGERLINARGETLAEKPSFRGSYKYQRCLIPASGFYEWKSQPGSKIRVPHFVHLKSRKVFAFAGLWAEWNSADGGPIRTCTVVTTTPNEVMASIHNRMPVILGKADYVEWLDASPRSPENLEHLLKPYAAADMEAYAVSTLVNSPANDRPDCILPA
jgi:putative SOS response-associated peptidase YedK